MTNKVSLYISADSNLQQTRNMIKSEIQSAKNIQSDWTRTEVGGALRKILAQLNEMKKVPTKGIIIFASSESAELVEPPVTNYSNIYRCGSDFYKEPLKLMKDEEAGEKYGMILIDNKEATIAWFRGKSFVSLWHGDSRVMGKHSKGGQSQRRFERDHEEQLKKWQRKIADKANQIFQDMKITNIIVGGPAYRKRKFVDDNYLDYRIKVMAIVDCEYVEDVVGPRECLVRWK